MTTPVINQVPVTDPYLGSIAILLSLVIFVGNLITLLIIYQNRVFRNSSGARIALGNLALADLLCSSNCLASGIGYLNIQTIQSDDFLCILEAKKRYILQHVSFFALAVITINRYVVVVNGKRTHAYFRTWLYTISSWVFVITMLIIFDLTHLVSVHYLPNLDGACQVIVTPFILYMTVATTIIPAYGLIIFCYVKIYRKVREHTRRVEDSLRSTNTQKERRVGKIVLMVLTLFGVSYIPLVITFVIMQMMLGYAVPTFWTRLTYIIYYTSHANNIFVYCIMDREYRSELKRLFRFRQRVNSV